MFYCFNSSVRPRAKLSFGHFYGNFILVNVQKVRNVIKAVFLLYKSVCGIRKEKQKFSQIV